MTGASSGIGAHAAAALAQAHPDDRLLLVGRNPERTREVAARVGGEAFISDFSRLDSVRDLARELREATDRIDVLANNAGGIFQGPAPTEDGFERTFQINHLAPLLLTHELLDVLLSSKASVVATASLANVLFARPKRSDVQSLRSFRSDRAYGNAKLANIITTQQLHERFHHQGLSTVAFHPGVVASNFASGSNTWMSKIYASPLFERCSISSQEGAANLAFFVDGTPGITWESGNYYNDRRRPGLRHPMAHSATRSREFFEQSSRMLGCSWAQ